MKTNSRALAIPAVYFVTLLALSGCHAPQWRVFQSKVPASIGKPAVQVEGERQAADFVARTITAPAESIPVAQKLSASLGEPEHRIEAKTPVIASNKALEALADGIREDQIERKKLNERLDKFDGKKIEGTGFNVFGLSLSLPVIGLIAFLILCPSVAIPLLLSTLKRVRGCLVSTVEGIQNFKADHPDVAQAINTKLNEAQDAVHKALVKKIKAEQ